MGVKSPRALEVECEDSIIAHAERFGWRVHAERTSHRPGGKFETAIKGSKGYPDLTMIHPKVGLVVVELKRAPNKVEPEQEVWLQAFVDADVRTAVWWVPEQLPAIYRYLIDPVGQPMPGRLS